MKGCVEITIRYAGSYKVGNEYAHKFHNSGTSGCRKNGNKHDGVVEDFAVVENKESKDDIVSSVDDGESKWLNAASPENSSSSDPITDAAETAIKEAIGTVEDRMSWAIATGEIVNALAYHGNDGPGSTDTWTCKWEYNGGSDAPVSECSNSAKFWIVVPESRRGQQIEVKTKQKTDIPPINDDAAGSMPVVSQTWTPRTDDDSSSDSQSTSSLSSGETIFKPGSVRIYSDLFMDNGKLNDDISRTKSIENLPNAIQMRTDSDTVEKFYVPWEVTVKSNKK